MTKLSNLSAIALVASAVALPALAQDKTTTCGRISIAEMNWASAGFAAWLDKIILQEGYGCTVDLVSGDTMPTFTSMNEKGEPDVAPELWVNAVKEPLDAATREGRLVITTEILQDGGVEGWWVPKYIIDANPEITTVEAALKRPDLFPAPEYPDRGAIMNCPAGWSCQISTTNLFKAFDGASFGFDLVDSGSAAGLDGSIAAAFQRQKGWLGYYWAPTPVMGKYDMVRLDMGAPVDKAHFDSCLTKADCADPKVSGYPTSEVFTVVSAAFEKNHPVALDYLQKRAWSNDVLNDLLAWMDDNQATNEDAAYHFLEQHPDLWKPWLSAEAAAKVEAAL